MDEQPDDWSAPLQAIPDDDFGQFDLAFEQDGFRQALPLRYEVFEQ